MNRRETLMGGALAAGMAGLPWAAKAQSVRTPSRTAQVPAMWRQRIGDRIVTTVSDGFVPFEDWHSPNITTEDRAALLEEAFLPTDVYQGSINTFVVDDGERGVTLVDAGAGPILGPTSGHLLRNLRAAGYTPEDVTTVLATHLHPDHIGGVYDALGVAVFPNAELVISEADHAFWTDEGVRAQALKEARSLWAIAGDALGAYGGRVRRFEGPGDVAPGIAPILLPGHTPGQTGFVVSGGGEALLIWADVVHFAPLQLPRPEVVFAFDVNPALAVETRRRTLDMAAMDRLRVAGMHLPFPGSGHVERDGDRYRFVPSRWGYDM